MFFIKDKPSFSQDIVIHVSFKQFVCTYRTRSPIRIERYYSFSIRHLYSLIKKALKITIKICQESIFQIIQSNNIKNYPFVKNCLMTSIILNIIYRPFTFISFIQTRGLNISINYIEIVLIFQNITKNFLIYQPIIASQKIQPLTLRLLDSFIHRIVDAFVWFRIYLDAWIIVRFGYF